MYVRVVVYPGGKKELLEKTGDHRYEIRVKEPAERNLANSRVIELIAETYGVPKKAVRVLSGHHSSRKILSLPDT